MNEECEKEREALGLVLRKLEFRGESFHACRRRGDRYNTHIQGRNRQNPRLFGRRCTAASQRERSIGSTATASGGVNRGVNMAGAELNMIFLLTLRAHAVAGGRV